MRLPWPTVLLAALALPVTWIAAAPVELEPDDEPPPPGCKLFEGGSESAPARECVSCHRAAAAGHATHPVDVHYEAMRGGSEASLRPLEEVVKRGVLVPEGKIRCATCHDARSEWKYHLALPPGAPAVPAVNPRDPRTYADDEGSAPRAEVPRSSWTARPRRERDVSPKPLCLACHGLD